MSEDGLGVFDIAAPGWIEQLIERWWADLPGSAVARDTQAWNIAHGPKRR
jgi:hypothetical protein